MKKSTVLVIGLLLLFIQSIFSQNKWDKKNFSKQTKTIYIESGINVSVPVHIEMYRSHRLGIGVNAKVSEIVSEKLELGIMAEYDYRFINKNNHDTIKIEASHKNFGIISIKPGIQFKLKSKSRWFWGVETGLGYAISDENNRIGLGFVSEYRGEAQFGSCSSLYFGKYAQRNLGFSINFTNFVAKGHAENTLGIKMNYCFNR